MSVQWIVFFYPMSNRVSDKAIIITYSRPQLKGRKLAELVPANKVWRTGANEATEIRILKPVKFGDTIINEGTYTLYSYPKEESTEIIINSAKYVWGAYNYDKSKDVARIDVCYRIVRISRGFFSYIYWKRI